MTIFEAVKQISCNDAAKHLGLRGKRTTAGQGRWLCPFHDDRHPSMACYDDSNRFYCFTCHASGDAANLFAKVRGLTPVEAAKAALTEFHLPIPGGCDRPRKDEAVIRQDLVERVSGMILDEYREGMALLLTSQADGMVAAMEKNHDPESWLWAHALQHACKVQEEAGRWQGMSREDVQEEVSRQLRENCVPRWGDPLPVPGVALFLSILDDLTRRMERFPRLNPQEQRAVLNRLCRTGEASAL